MIIPVGLNHVIRGWPRVTIALIACCTLVQIYASVWAPSPDDLSTLISARVAARSHEHADAPDASWESAVTAEVEQLANRIPIVRLGYPTGTGLSWRLFTAAFVHDGWIHLIGNMLFLWLAGAALEDRWGRLRFLGFYLAGAAASTLCFDALHSGLATTLVGASGAISALMGAFLVFFARKRIHFAYWFWTSAGTFELVAYIALPIWFGQQLVSVWLDDGPSGVSGVAFTAHISGFLFGLAAASAAKLASRRADAAADDAESADGAESAEFADAESADAPAPVRKPPRAIARQAPKAAAKAAAPPPPRPKLEAPAPPPPPRDPSDGPTFLG